MSPKQKKLEVLRLSNEESNRITKESLQTALIYLMNKKDIIDITVTELVKKAGVSRAAFYRNYNTTKDVLFDFSKNVLELLYSVLINYDFLDNIYDWYKFLFDHLKLNSNVIKLLLKAKVDFSSYLIIPKELDNINQYKLLSLEKGLLAIVSKWINSNMQETTEEMAKLCEEIFTQTTLLFKK